MFLSKYVQFRVICSLQYSIKINTIKVDPHSDWLQNGIVKPKNSFKNKYSPPNIKRTTGTGQIIGKRDSSAWLICP